MSVSHRASRTTHCCKNHSGRARLGLEQLEARELLAGGPTITQFLVPNTVAATTTLLRVTATDPASEPTLTYNWSLGLAPIGATPTFDVNNGTNQGKSETVTFDRPGHYSVSLTVTDQNNLSATRTAAFDVIQKVNRVGVVADTTTIDGGATVNLTATAFDQFGQAFQSQPTWKWDFYDGTPLTGGRVTLVPNLGTATVTENKWVPDRKLIDVTADGVRGQISISPGSIDPKTKQDYLDLSAEYVKYYPGTSLGLPESISGLDTYVQTHYPLYIAAEAGNDVLLADLAAAGTITNVAASTYRSHALYLLKYLAETYYPTKNGAGDFELGWATWITYNELNKVGLVDPTLAAATKTMAMQLSNPGWGNSFNQGWSRGTLGNTLAGEVFPTDPYLGVAGGAVQKSITNFWSLVQGRNGDFTEPSQNYSETTFWALIIGAETTSATHPERMADLKAATNLFDRYRDTLSPNGDLPSVGDNTLVHGNVPYGLIFQYAARLFNDGTFGTAADRVYQRAGNFGPSIEMLLSAGVGGYMDWLATPPPAEQPMPQALVVEIRQSNAAPKPPVVDSLVLNQSKTSGSPYFFEDLYVSPGVGHNHPWQAGQTSAYEVGNIPFLRGPNYHEQLPQYANMLVLDKPADLGTGPFPYLQNPFTVSEVADHAIDNLNRGLTFVGQDAAGDSYGSYQYNTYFTATTSERRQTILLSTGQLIVMDTLTPDASAAGLIGGPVWHLDVGGATPATGTNSGNTWYDAAYHDRNNSANLLLTFEGGAGRTAGLSTPPDGSSAAGIQTAFARETLAGRPTSFISVFMPHAAGSDAGQLARSVRIDRIDVNTASVTLRLADGSTVVVHYGADGWKVVRVPLVPTLQATALAEAQVQLAWTPPASGSPPTSFELQRSTAADFSAALVSQIVPGNQTNLTDTGLTAGTVYYYRLRSINASGPSDFSTIVSVTAEQDGPTVAQSATATPASVTGTTTGLAVLGGTVTSGGEASLTYSWAVTAVPTGATAPTLSFANGAANATNDAKNATATFVAAGDYEFTVTITDRFGSSATSTVRVTVTQTVTSVLVTPGTVTVTEGSSRSFTATVADQFGNTILGLPVVWSVIGSGIIDQTGIYTAPLALGSDEVVTARVGPTNGSARVTISAYSPPTVDTGANADPAPVVTNSTTLSVLGRTNTPGGEASLTYRWVATTIPPGAAAPLFNFGSGAANSSHAAASVGVTFSQVGDYGFEVTISDAFGATAVSDVIVSVVATPTSVVVTPATPTVVLGNTDTCAAVVTDQFGHVVPSLLLTWQLTSGSGSINADGIYSADGSTGPVEVTVLVDSARGAISATAFLTVTPPAPPTFVTPATVADNPVSGTSKTLSVLGTSVTPAGEAGLIYTWIVLSQPAGSPSPVFTPVGNNGTNAGKNLAVTFGAAGTYTFVVTETDAFGGTATSSVSTTVAVPVPVTTEPTPVPVPVPVPTPQPGPSVPVSVPVAATTPAASWIVTGADAGGLPLVHVYDLTGKLLAEFEAFDPIFRGGVRVATADVNGDGVRDVIVAAGPGGGPHVKIIDGTKLSHTRLDGQIADDAVLASFYAYDAGFRGGVNVATAHLVAGAPAEVVTGAGVGGGPHVRVFVLTSTAIAQLDGPLGSFMAYDPAFRGGVTVAAGALEGGTLDQVITGAGPGGGAHVKAFRVDGSLAASFLAFDPSFHNGISVAAAATTGAVGHDSILVGAGGGADPEVRAFSKAGWQLTADFLAFDPLFKGGVRVGSVETGTGTWVLTGAGSGGGPHLRSWDAATMTPVGGMFAYDVGFRGGIFVA